MKLRKLSIKGKELFVKEYNKQMADIMLSSHSKYSTGETMWEEVTKPAKAKAKAKAKPEVETPNTDENEIGKK